MAAGAYYACTIGRSRVALCLPGASYQPLYWFTRCLTLILNVCSKKLSLSSFPQKLSPWLNLTKLMTPTSWACILVSILSVVFCFNAGSVVLKKKMGIGMKFIELNLYPFRFEKISPCLTKYIFFPCLQGVFSQPRAYHRSSLLQPSMADVGCVWRTLHH